MWKTSSLNPKYEVNELGQIRYKKTRNILGGFLDKDGYRKHKMRDENGKDKTYFAHVIVALEFCEGRTQNRRYVNHKNFNKTDNRASNLEWVLHQEWRKNQSFFTNVSRANDRESCLNRGKCAVIQYSLDFKPIKEYESYMDAQRETGVRSGNISLCCRGKRHTAGGFIWRDKKEGSTTIERHENEPSRVGENRSA